jgi:hypothetical protein
LAAPLPWKTLADKAERGRPKARVPRMYFLGLMPDRVHRRVAYHLQTNQLRFFAPNGKLLRSEPLMDPDQVRLYRDIHAWWEEGSEFFAPPSERTLDQYGKVTVRELLRLQMEGLFQLSTGLLGSFAYYVDPAKATIVARKILPNALGPAITVPTKLPILDYRVVQQGPRMVVATSEQQWRGKVQVCYCAYEFNKWAWKKLQDWHAPTDPSKILSFVTLVQGKSVVVYYTPLVNRSAVPIVGYKDY